MGSFSVIHWLVLGLIILLLFGRGRFSEMMGDVAKGFKSFKKGLTEDDEPETTTSLTKPATRLQQQPVEPVAERDLQAAPDQRPQG